MLSFNLYAAILFHWSLYSDIFNKTDLNWYINRSLKTVDENKTKVKAKHKTNDWDWVICGIPFVTMSCVIEIRFVLIKFSFKIWPANTMYYRAWVWKRENGRHKLQEHNVVVLLFMLRTWFAKLLVVFFLGSIANKRQYFDCKTIANNASRATNI